MILDFFKDNFIPPAQSSPDPAAKPRIRYIDLAKGITIILVVLYHNSIFTDIPGINAARMPLYFVLSGMFFKTYNHILTFLSKKTNNLIIPFLFFAFMGFLNSVYFHHLKVSYVLSTVIYNPKVPNLPVWFLLCLFWVNIIYYIIHFVFRRPPLRLIAVIACGVAGYILNTHRLYLPFFLSSSLTALPFFYFGMLLRNFLANLSLSQIKTLVIAVALFAAGCIYSYFRQSPVIEFRTNHFSGNPIEVYLVSFTMVMSFLMLCKAIVWLPIISYLGRYSIIVLGFHLPFMLGMKQFTPTLFNHPLLHIETFLISILLCWLMIPLCRRFIPVLTAQSPLLPDRSSRAAKTASLQEC